MPHNTTPPPYQLETAPHPRALRPSNCVLGPPRDTNTSLYLPLPRPIRPQPAKAACIPPVTSTIHAVPRYPNASHQDEIPGRRYLQVPLSLLDHQATGCRLPCLAGTITAPAPPAPSATAAQDYIFTAPPASSSFTNHRLLGTSLERHFPLHPSILITNIQARVPGSLLFSGLSLASVFFILIHSSSLLSTAFVSSSFESRCITATLRPLFSRLVRCTNQPSLNACDSLDSVARLTAYAHTSTAYTGQTHYASQPPGFLIISHPPFDAHSVYIRHALSSSRLQTNHEI